MTLIRANLMPVSLPVFRHTLDECGRASTGSTGAGVVTGSLSDVALKAKQYEAFTGCLSRIIMK
jgi:hypothetical protein